MTAKADMHLGSEQMFYSAKRITDQFSKNFCFYPETFGVRAASCLIDPFRRSKSGGKPPANASRELACGLAAFALSCQIASLAAMRTLVPRFAIPTRSGRFVGP